MVSLSFLLRSHHCSNCSLLLGRIIIPCRLQGKQRRNESVGIERGKELGIRCPFYLIWFWFRVQMDRPDPPTTDLNVRHALNACQTHRLCIFIIFFFFFLFADIWLQTRPISCSIRAVSMLNAYLLLIGGLFSSLSVPSYQTNYKTLESEWFILNE